MADTLIDHRDQWASGGVCALCAGYDTGDRRVRLECAYTKSNLRARGGDPAPMFVLESMRSFALSPDDLVTGAEMDPSLYFKIKPDGSTAFGSVTPCVVDSVEEITTAVESLLRDYDTAQKSSAS